MNCNCTPDWQDPACRNKGQCAGSKGHCTPPIAVSESRPKTVLRIPCASGDGSELRIYRGPKEMRVELGWMSDSADTGHYVTVSLSSPFGRAVESLLVNQERIDAIAAGGDQSAKRAASLLETLEGLHNAVRFEPGYFNSELKGQVVAVIEAAGGKP